MVFISYAKEDGDFAERLYHDLQQAGVKPWMDTRDLIPGQPWQLAIKSAINECSYFLAVLSSRSVAKRGYVQKEVRYALEIADELPEDKIYIIPVRLDNCEPSFEGLRRLHRADLFPSYERGLKELLRVFKYQSEEKPQLIEVVHKQSGVIKKITDRGFGFISMYGQAEDLFFHSAELVGIRFDELREGDAVRLSTAQGPRGLVAVSIERA